MNIDYISNLSLKNTSGGWNGINFKLFEKLSEFASVNYLGPINPNIIISEKITSKLLRVFNMEGKYFYFSDKRLGKINSELQNKKLSGDFIFYFGATPWVKLKPVKPYAVYLDICFPCYLDLFLTGQKFSRSDIERISDLEFKFLSNAKHIFWGSKWAFAEARKMYKSDFIQSTILSTGGHVPIPEMPKMNPQKKLIFISLNFEKKGGLLAFETFKLLKIKFPELTLSIIGERPPDQILEEDRVNYVGLLDKDNDNDLKRFISEISDAFFLIHPTIMDTMGAVIAEAGYYGVPTIAPNNFGIPDLIENGKTGILVDLPLTVNKFVDGLDVYLRGPEKYNKMREDVYLYMIQNRSWDAIAKKILMTLQN